MWHFGQLCVKITDVTLGICTKIRFGCIITWYRIFVLVNRCKYGLLFELRDYFIGGEQVSTGQVKLRLRVVVGQRATLKAD